MTRIPVGSTVTSFPARTWNQLVDRLLGAPPPGLPQSVRGEPRAGQVVIEVEPQTDVGELGVLILDEPVFLPTATTGGGNDTADAATLQAPAMRAVAPATANLSGAVAITLEPIASGNRGRAVVQGVSWARVDIQTAGDTACGPIDADKTRLESGAGALTILWAEKADAGTKTGEQWCLVLLGGGSSADKRRIAYKVNEGSGVTNGQATFTADNVRPLSGGVNPVASTGDGVNLTVNDAVKAYTDNEAGIAEWDGDNAEWIDATDVGAGGNRRIIAKVNEGSGVTNGQSSFTVDNVRPICDGNNPVASTADAVNLTLNDAKQAYADNAVVYGEWDNDNAEWIDVTDVEGESELFDCLIEYGQSLTAGAWNDGTRKWTDGSGTVTLLTDNEDGTYDEAGTQSVKWRPNVAVSPPTGKAYRGHGVIVGGVYKLEAVYTCEGVTWTSGE